MKSILLSCVAVLAMTPAFAQELADGITGATFVEIPKAGHLTPLEAPATFNHTLRSFIAKGAA